MSARRFVVANHADLTQRCIVVLSVFVIAAAALALPAHAESTSGYDSKTPERAYTVAVNGDFMSRQIQAMPDLIVGLFNAIEAIGKYPAPASYPSVRQVTRLELEREACAGQRCRYVRAAYLPDKGLYLENSLDPQASIMDRSILLHELVHHVQALAQRYAHLGDCERRREEEREAYAIQNAYLSRIGGGRQILFPERGYRCDAAQS